MTAERDYPQIAATRGRIEPAPRRVRGFPPGTLVNDPNTNKPFRVP